MDFYDKAGLLALGSRLRAVSENLTQDAAMVYDLYGVGLSPRWFPVFFVLARGEPITVTELADQIGHSHASVSQIAKSLQQRGMVNAEPCPVDGRVRRLKLSETGRQLFERSQPLLDDVRSAVNEIIAEMEHDIWATLEEFEGRISDRSFFQRVRQRYRAREGDCVRVDDYTDADCELFERLNIAWIEEYFEGVVEDFELRILRDPRRAILDRDGHILIARYDGRAIGTCALIALPEGDGFELAKMVVDESMRGRGIGEILGRAAIERAHEYSARRVYLGSNTKLKAAVSLYEKLGFVRMTGTSSPYHRCNIEMELRFDSPHGMDAERTR